ncbi:uncharacterized protein LOC117640419 [Thrips palmi]|uniref:Uncharacterized protein LOC117640419 n=1 Tax=Thrips palmi TaxID=161013 RepID=A0A6P8YFW0_THRPL|nr:uncharacterized protein LOC117640419 [Thrips palmi]XP_034232813.1 uncharacterized protein LOC117640419 [Thrips palmi]
MWTASSPPVSSRDSAYNGGISSGGESRGPTPDQAGVKKHSKRSEKKGKKKADPKRPYSADTKIRRKVENKFMKKLLEDERNELHEQRLRVDPWHGINQDDHGDAILRNIDDLHIEDHVDDSLTEHDSTANTDSVSGQSIEEDMVEEVDESVEVESTKEANGEDSVITDKSSASVAGTEGSVPSQSLAKSSPSPNMQQTSTQTDPPAQNNDPKVLSSGSQYPSPTHSGSISTKQSMSRSSTSGSSNKSLSTEKNRETKKPQLESKVIKEVSASLSSAKESNSKKDEKLENNQYLVNNRQNDMSYARLVNMITKDVLERRVVTYKALKAICDEHIEANCDKLDKERMQQEVDKLQIQLEIPRDDHVDCLNYVADLPKREKIPFTSKFIPSLVDVDRFALLSGPPPMAEDSPFRSTGLHSQKLIGALDSWKKPLFVNAEDSPLQHENLKLDRVKENTFFSADPTKTTSSPSLIDPVETVNDVSPPMQNDQISSFTPQSYGAQFLRDNFNKAEKLLDVADDSKKLSSPVISTKGIESFKYLKSSPLLENEYLNHLPASADDFSVIPNTMEGQSTSGSTANAVPCACKERKCRCCASDDFESYWKTYMEKSSTMQLFTGLSLGHLNDWNERANLNIEMENSIKEIEKELRQTGFHREEVSTPVIAERDEPEVVELFHSEKVRSAASEHNSLTSTIQSAIKDKFDSAPLEDKGSPDITHEQPNADGTIDSKSKLQSNPLIENSSSIPFGTGQNSDILRLKLW